jgi:hypothetical protein
MWRCAAACWRRDENPLVLASRFKRQEERATGNHLQKNLCETFQSLRGRARLCEAAHPAKKRLPLAENRRAPRGKSGTRTRYAPSRGRAPPPARETAPAGTPTPFPTFWPNNVSDWAWAAFLKNSNFQHVAFAGDHFVKHRVDEESQEQSRQESGDHHDREGLLRVAAHAAGYRGGQ